MDYQFLILIFATLACPVGMGAMIWWMHKSMRQPSASEEKSVLHLVQEDTNNNQSLEAPIAELEQYLATQRQTKQ